MDTLRNLYSKTQFRLKWRGLLSNPSPDNIGVNQGGNASPTLFRRYMSDLMDYLNEQFGVCIGEEIVIHLLWADDLVLFSDTPQGLQKQLDGFFNFVRPI